MVEPDSRRVALELRGLSVRLSGEARPVLRNLDLEIGPGEVVGVSGRSGTGKTTLLHTIAGLVPWLRPAEVGGEILLGDDPLGDLDPGQRAHLIATCLDRPDAQLFLPTVGQELEAARRLHGDSPFFERAAQRLGVDALAHRRITELSSGQRQRVALAVTLGASPRPVLLDEPGAHLDGDAVRALEGLLTEAREEGASVFLGEQAGWRLGVGVDRWLELDDGRLGPRNRPSRPDPPPPPALPGEAVVLSAKGLVVERGGRRLLDGVDLEVRAGEVVLLSGPNGAGKSTLARVLVGLWKVASGSVTREGRVGLMLPSAELQLFSETVAGEVGEGDPSRGEAARVLRRHRLDHLAARAPWTLSRGERQRLVHAALDLQRPALMIVDEPGQGLDPQDLLDFVDLIHRRAEKGRAYLVISHRRELASAAHRHLRIDNLRLVEAAS